MAFTTTQGSGANDATSFVGTAGVDSLAVQNPVNGFYVSAEASGDNILLSNFTNSLIIEDGEVFGGQGNDSITTAGVAGGAANNVTVVDSYINGNTNNDTIGVAGTNYSNSQVYGGQGNDTLLVNNLFNGFINGNKNTDTITTSAGGTLTGQIYGGQGTDTITINGNVNGGGVRGDKDVDIINIGGGATAQNMTNASFNGNAAADQITWDVRGTASAVTTTTVYGGSGDDVITAAGATTTEEAYLSGDKGADTLIVNAASAQAFTLDGGDGIDAITTNGTGAMRVIGGKDADLITSTGAADTIVQNVGDSNAATGVTRAGAALGAGLALQANDVISIDADVVTTFAATDRISIGSTTSNGVGVAGQSVAATTFAGVNVIYGTFNQATNTFLTAANQGGGADTLIFTSAGGINMSSAVAAFNTNAVITIGNSANITAASFV